MNQETYSEELIKALNIERDSILTNVNTFLQKIPLEAVRVNIIISPSQDGDGQFSIHGGLNGPNLYHLNKKVENWTRILDIEYGIAGFEPNFPQVDPFSITYSVNDIIAETCANWFNSNSDDIDDSHLKVAISIYSDHN